MKRRFLVVHDYTTGAVVHWVMARSAEEIRAVLWPPGWAVYPEDDPERPKIWDTIPLPASDIDEKDRWLLDQIYIQQRESEGKWPFVFRGMRNGVAEYRTIWARDISDITSQYRGLESLMGVPISWEDLQSMGCSDVDQPDEFLAEYHDDA